MGMVRTAKVISLKFCKAGGPKHPAPNASGRPQGTTGEERGFAPLCLAVGTLWI